MSSPFRIGMSTFGFLYRASLHDSLALIAEAGYHEVELASCWPQLEPTGMSADERSRLKATFGELGLRCVSINPIEMNLISANPEIRAVCLAHYVAAARLLSDLGGGVVMVVPGRYNGLIPMPEPQALELFQGQLSVLLEEAARLGVELALETTPFGFLASTSALLGVIEEVGDPRLGLGVDVANVFPQEDPADAVRLAGRHLKMVQFSGTWRTRWAHASIADGDLDVDGMRVALEQMGYQGPCIYELVDGEDPMPRIADDLVRLEAAGWAR